ncbi:transcription elongation factor S-II [Astrocystis sublimbata]|nr:transcription elongation factor S-II [Astrocystis sublimbata]
MAPLTRTVLLEAARSFCNSFAQKKPLDEILSHFATTSSSNSRDDGENSGGGGEVVVHEHGLPQLAPFLGRDFYGVDGARQYFETVGKHLKYEDMRFGEFVVDVEGGDSEGGGGGKVAVRGEARFTWIQTEKSWDETFVYILRFDEIGKLVRYEVWADSGAAYLARRGELGKK